MRELIAILRAIVADVEMRITRARMKQGLPPMTEADWEHARRVESSGSLDFWDSEPDLYGE